MSYYQIVGTMKFEEGFEIHFLKSKMFNAVVLWDYKGKSVSDTRYREVAEFAKCVVEKYAELYNQPDPGKGT